MLELRLGKTLKNLELLEKEVSETLLGVLMQEVN